LDNLSDVPRRGADPAVARDSKNLIRWVALLTGVAALLVGLKNYFDYNAWVNAELAAHMAC